MAIPDPKNGVYEIVVSSTRYVYPRIQLVAARSQLARAILVVNQTEVAPRGGIYFVRALRPVAFYEVAVPFSWYAMLTSPMMLMGIVTMVMMGIMQLLIASLGDIEEVRRELRGDNDNDDEDGKEIPRKALPEKKKKK